MVQIVGLINLMGSRSFRILFYSLLAEPPIAQNRRNIKSHYRLARHNVTVISLGKLTRSSISTQFFTSVPSFTSFLSQTVVLSFFKAIPIIFHIPEKSGHLGICSANTLNPQHHGHGPRC